MFVPVEKTSLDSSVCRNKEQHIQSVKTKMSYENIWLMKDRKLREGSRSADGTRWGEKASEGSFLVEHKSLTWAENVRIVAVHWG